MGFSIFTDLITPTKYLVEDFPTISPGDEQLAAIRDNTAAFGSAKALAVDFNAFMRSEAEKALAQGIPGYKAIADQFSSNIQAGLRGELSPSDLAATERSSAARALASGVAGSDFGAALTARDIGLRQYQVQQQAQAAATSYLGTMKSLTAAPMFDFSHAFLTPAQRIETAFRNASNKWSVQNLRNQMAVQPEPWEKALAGFGDSVLDAVAAYYTGGASLAAGQGSGARGQKGFTTDDWAAAGGGIGAQQSNAWMSEFYGGGVTGGYDYSRPALGAGMWA